MIEQQENDSLQELDGSLRGSLQTAQAFGITPEQAAKMEQAARDMAESCAIAATQVLEALRAAFAPAATQILKYWEALEVTRKAYNEQSVLNGGGGRGIVRRKKESK